MTGTDAKAVPDELKAFGWPSPSKFKLAGPELKEIPDFPVTQPLEPVGVPAVQFSLGPTNAVLHVLVAAADAMAKTADAGAACEKVTHTVRRWAMAVLWAYRNNDRVSSWKPRALKSFESKIRGTAKTASTPKMTMTMMSSIKVKPDCLKCFIIYSKLHSMHWGYSLFAA